MKIIKRYIIITCLMLLCMTLSSCWRTELCYDHYPKLSLTFDWEREWERDHGMGLLSTWDDDFYGYTYDQLRPGLPEWVNMVVYKDNQSIDEQYFPPVGGDMMFKQKGVYSFLLYNGDTEYIVLSDMASLPDARASSTSRSRSTIGYILERHPGVRSTNPPDLLYSAFMENVSSPDVHETKHLPMRLQPLVYTYIIRYEFEYGIHNVELARGALGGMAESVYLRDGRTSDESIIVLYDCEVKDYGCEAQVRSFGIPGYSDQYYGRNDADDRPYTLNLEVLLTNGTTLQFNYDVADQLRKQPRGGVITISGIRIEDEDNKRPMGDSGFDVDLSGWSEEDVDLPVSSN